MSTLAYQPPTQLGFPDRSGRLLAAGIVLVICGMLTGCMTAMIPVALMIPQPNQQPVPAWQIVPAILLYGVLTLILLSLGAGSIIKRRWSRPLALIFSTHWLIAGIVTVLAMPLFWPIVRDSANSANAPPGAATGFLIGMIIAMGFLILFMVAIPATVLLLVRHDDVRRSLEFHDPHPRWTDGCPLPVLGLALTLAVIGVLTLTAVPVGVAPVAGTFLTGWPARALLGVLVIAYFLAGYLAYRMNMGGWWLGLGLTIGLSLAFIPSALWMPLADYYRATGTPDDQIELLLQHERTIRFSMAGFAVLFAAAFALYMLRTRKHLCSPVVYAPGST